MNINPFDLLKNAEKIQEQMSFFQEKLGSINTTGSSGGGMVEIDLNGKIEVIAVRIAPEAMEGGDTEMLQDLIMAAFANALEKVREEINREMGAMAGSLGIAGIPGMPGCPGGFPGVS
ncbi:MAG: YbaB/EbfC family nucleoid-associated protein [Treponema sp.]|jgi:DNA-binding YbaB/EbfC family protein|nr:YbaB/EbfC family nucleoid-associated protein [Treponema sp.]